ncbi:hypothetical protein DZ701_23960 [Enterobacter hormaechei]|nr:hypothetical protein DZ701_23960 [Enterobacter hormaechei]
MSILHKYKIIKCFTAMYLIYKLFMPPYKKENQYNSKMQYTLSESWICPYISRHLLSLNPLQARCRRYSRGER